MPPGRPRLQTSKKRWQVSTGGGTRPLWARNGRELFYLATPGRVMTVPIQTGSSFAPGNPRVVFDGPYLAPNSSRTYDVSPNGERFLMIKAASSDKSSAAPSLIVVQNWVEELKRRVPSN